MTDRSALLIGVPSCDNDLFGALPDVVSADIARMTEALHQSGYEVRHCGVGDGAGREPTGNRIRAAMMKAFREAPAGGVLVVYFSGHGVVIDGQSYLVPQDGYAGPDGPDPESLVPLVPRHMEHCLARLVVLFVDACRNDLSAPLTSLAGSGVLPYPAAGAFVLVNSCGLGERSLHGQDGSYFTQALAEVLDRRYPARTLDDVYHAVVRRLARKAARMEGMEQAPEIVSAQRGQSAAPGTVVICDGDRVSEAWRRAVEGAPLWRRSTLAEPALDRVRRLVLGVVDECAQHWLDAEDYLTRKSGLSDPWSAQDYPVRVLAAVDSCLPADADLTAVELAALVAVPFLRETAFSAGLRLAATVAPDDFSRTFLDGPRSDLEITHAMHEHVCRRAEGLARRGRTESRDALAMWLVHRWLAGRSSLWDDPAVAVLCQRLAAAVTAGSATGLTERELCSLLRVLMECVGAEADDQRLIEHLERHVFDPRLRALAAALWLAGVMAADTRRMPTVVVDHVGIGAELQLSALHAATVQASWQPGSNGLSLYAVCDHPALLAAFADLVQRASLVRATLRTLDLAPDLAGGLPAGFTAEGLRPEIHDGTPVFDTPLLRFRLSDEKVRELLMGRQLYGEPDLAIRELYQNALDACRYRHTRRDYLKCQECATTDWSGTISFRQGVDTGGREFIECSDNGIGMSRETLMSTFANAGERFVYRPSFRAEQARWQEVDPPLRLIPNSQFGVGVFSYFMIAEEIQIVTRPVNEEDIVASQAHHVRIASSGSLFQITSSTGMPGGGTRVRLYLTGEDHISVLQTMRRLLWIAEYRVDVTEDGAAREVWQPEQLRYPGATVEPLKDGKDLWWVSGEGGLAADGIRTNEERHGLVVNLRGPRRPQFTVNRNRLRQWDKEWISRQVRESLPALLQWPGLTLSWLWKVTETTPALAEDIFARLVESGHELPVEGFWGRATPAPAGLVGCLPVDRELFNGEMVSFHDASHLWMAAWRVGVWKGIANVFGVHHVAEATRLDGFPVVRPLDAEVLTKVYEAGRMYRSGGQYGRPSVDDLLDSAADEDDSPAVRLRRLRRYAIIGLDLTAARDIPPIHSVFTTDDRPRRGKTEQKEILGAVAAWAPPGRPARRAAGGWLATASSGLHVPLGEVLRRAAALVPPGWTPPGGSELGELRDHVCTPDDVSLFAQESHLYPGPPWVGPVVSPAHVLRISSSLGHPVEHVLRLFDRFAPLGYEVAGRHHYPGDLTTTEHEALRYVEEVGYRLTPLHLLLIASGAGMTVRRVRADLDRLADAALLRLPADDPAPDILVSDDERAIIGEDLQAWDARNQRQTLATGWLAVRELAWAIGGREESGFEERLARRRRLLDIIDLRRPVGVPEIIDLAYRLDSTIAAAIDYYRVLFPHSADLSALPEAAQRSLATCHRYEEWLALLGDPAFDYGQHDVSWGLRPGDIVNGSTQAGQPVTAFLDRLEPFRVIGAPLPTLDPPARAVLSQQPADKYDRAMLFTVDESGLERFVDTITPLWLVQVAGKFGWTCTEAHGRMARLQPLGLTLTYPPDACPDEIVSWQDLLVLTEYLDGQEPAVSGQISDAHIRAGGEEIGESVEQVRTRLRRYAILFEIRLDEGGPVD